MERALSSASFCLIPADHVPLVVLLSPCPLLCVHIGVNHSCFLSTVCCPAVRIHNHTVLPSSHNSSSVYTNDSAYTNISATVGEHSVPARLRRCPDSLSRVCRSWRRLIDTLGRSLCLRRCCVSYVCCDKSIHNSYLTE